METLADGANSHRLGSGLASPQLITVSYGPSCQTLKFVFNNLYLQASYFHLEKVNCITSSE
jgi:hypothetical protein